MPFATTGQISRAEIPGGVEITEARYLELLEGMLEGKQVTLRGGEILLVAPEVPEPEVPEVPEVPVEFESPSMAAQIAALRWNYETGGFLLNGMVVETDDRSKLMLTIAFNRATLDSSYTIPWKSPAGFITLTSSNIKQLAAAMHDFVEACFARERELLELLQTGTLLPTMLSLGWPTNAVFEGG